MADFWFALPDIAGAIDNATETIISPRPSTVEYPNVRATLHETEGAVIVQQPTRNVGVHTWTWSGYPYWLAAYQALWISLLKLRSRHRLEAAETYPYVFLKEDLTNLFRSTSVAAGPTVTENYSFFKCRVLEVSRQLRQSGSSAVVYESTTLKFTVDDTAYNNVG